MTLKEKIAAAKANYPPSTTSSTGPAILPPNILTLGHEFVYDTHHTVKCKHCSDYEYSARVVASHNAYAAWKNPAGQLIQTMSLSVCRSAPAPSLMQPQFQGLNTSPSTTIAGVVASATSHAIWFDANGQHIPPPTAPVVRSASYCRSLDCGVELCDFLDAYYGSSERAGEHCAKCRRRKGL